MGLATPEQLGAKPAEDEEPRGREMFEEKVWPLLAAGTIKPQIYRTFPLAQAAQAHALMETSAHVGKIVLVT